MLRILPIVTLLIAAAAYAEDDSGGKACCPAPTQQLAQAELPQGHPPVGESKTQLPPGHPPMPATSQPAMQHTTADIAVRAIIGTEGMAIPAGAPVTLSLIHGRQIIANHKAELDAHGVVVFEDIMLAGAVTPQVVINYHGVEYAAVGKPIRGDKAQLNVTVYDVTTKEPDWTIKMRHLMVSPEAHGVFISDVYVIENPTDRSYVAANHDGHIHPTFALPLPKGATEVKPTRGFILEKTQVQDGKLVTSTPLNAGESQFGLVYRLPAVDGKITLPVSAVAPTKTVRVFLPATDGEVNVNGLTDDGVRNMGSTHVRMLTGVDLPEGHNANVTLGGFTDAPTSQPAASSKPSSAPKVVAGVGVLGALIAGIVMMLIKKPQKKA